VSPEQVVREALRRAKRGFCLRACADSAMMGASVAALASLSGLPWIGALIAGAASLGLMATLGCRRWTDARVAREIERTTPTFQNLLVTAQESLAGRSIHPVVSRELIVQAANRVTAVGAAGWKRMPVARMALAMLCVVAAGLLTIRGINGEPIGASSHDFAVAAPPESGTLSLRVTVTPPGYVRQPISTLDNPAVIVALEGSTIRLDASVPGGRPSVQLVEPGQPPQSFSVRGDAASLELVATTSRVFVIRRSDAAGENDKLMQLQVQRDARPTVTVERPGRDLLFGAPTGRVPLRIVARDDLNVAAVALRYTKIAGSGETFTFSEGELPLQVTPNGVATTRAANGTLVLEQLQLEDGDTVVYRAVVRDDKPGADPVASESFLVEIGKRGEASSTGFSLPEERDRQGLSQQMVIMKTERLQAERGKLDEEALLERSRLLAVEQRMVRAEFVFLTGGEVVDEVEEAEHSHELAAGRLENASQVELLNAVREMSRAEARLNAGDTQQALVFERAALRALERAFDRRRYFLRTLPERARIDPSRRLSGDSATADPALPARSELAADVVAQQIRDVLGLLSTAVQTQRGLDAALAARVVALDSQAPVLQQSAAILSANTPPTQKLDAAIQARTHLLDLLRRRLAPAPIGRLRFDPLAGFYERSRQ
jgi:hypothetical protein